MYKARSINPLYLDPNIIYFKNLPINSIDHDAFILFNVCYRAIKIVLMSMYTCLNVPYSLTVCSQNKVTALLCQNIEEHLHSTINT